MAGLPEMTQELRLSVDTRHVEDVIDVFIRHLTGVRDDLRALRQPDSGARSVDEVRAEHGQKPWNLPETQIPIVFTPDGSRLASESRASRD